jgi:hypothetical protein
MGLSFPSDARELSTDVLHWRGSSGCPPDESKFALKIDRLAPTFRFTFWRFSGIILIDRNYPNPGTLQGNFKISDRRK